MKAVARLFAAILSLFAVSAAHADWLHREESIMGTRIYVELWHEDRIQGEAAIDAVMADMRRIDELMSHYKPESQLSQINIRGRSSRWRWIRSCST